MQFWQPCQKIFCQNPKKFGSNCEKRRKQNNFFKKRSANFASACVRRSFEDSGENFCQKSKNCKLENRGKSHIFKEEPCSSKMFARHVNCRFVKTAGFFTLYFRWKIKSYKLFKKNFSSESFSETTENSFLANNKE